VHPLLRSTISRRWASLLAVGLAFTAVTGVASPASADQTGCSPLVALKNGSFESPVIAENTWAPLDQTLFDGWSTTDPSGQIEIWHTPFLGVIPFEADQLAELNYTDPTSLYQDVATTPGERIVWSVAHRGRDGVDVAAVELGAPGTPTTQATMTDGTEWGRYSGVYTVPDGQTITRFTLTPISTAGDQPGVGNLVDAASLTSASCIVSSKSVTNLSGASTMVAGDTLRFTIDSVNLGASPAVFTTLNDALPAGLTLVPGSITSTDAAAALTGSAGDDEGTYDVDSQVLTVGIGSGAGVDTGGTLDPGQQSIVTFDATVDTPAPASITNTATIQYGDEPDPDTVLTATSNTVAMTAAAVAQSPQVSNSIDAAAAPAAEASTARLAETGLSSTIAFDGAILLLIIGLALTARSRRSTELS
jgi:uncharacterized repeat protein (TIGR01451 family)